MTKTNIIIVIFFIVILLVVLSIILYKYKGEKLDNLKKKLDNCENEFYSKIEEKHKTLLSLIEVVINKYKVESKAFDDVKSLELDSTNLYKNENLLNKCHKEIIQVIEDNIKVRQTKVFKEQLNKYEEIELHLISIRTFYNKYTLIYNNIIKKFPYNFISKFKGYKIRSLIDGKELDTNFNNDLEV